MNQDKIPAPEANLFSFVMINIYIDYRGEHINPIPYGILSFSQLHGGGGGAFWPTPQKVQLG